MNPDDVTRLEARINGLHDKMDELRRILLGNGCPEKGLAFRLVRVEERLCRATYWNRLVAGAVICAAVSGAVLLLAQVVALIVRAAPVGVGP